MKPTLLVLAAGVGSRYGGLKQLATVTDYNESVIDFSIYDALAVGFKRIVFLIRRELQDDFKCFFDHKFADKIEVCYAFQQLNSLLPVGMAQKAARTRRKPWGTGHATLCAAEKIGGEPFVVINGDDYYGRSAFQSAMDFFNSEYGDNSIKHATVAYRLADTLSENGTVSRGIITLNADNYVQKVAERTGLRAVDNQWIEDTVCGDIFSADQLVSMNFFCFKPAIVPLLQSGFDRFISDSGNDLLTDEFFLPSLVSEEIVNRNIRLKAVAARERWYGLTYAQDRDVLEKAIADKVANKIYPQPLWQG